MDALTRKVEFARPPALSPERGVAGQSAPLSAADSRALAGALRKGDPVDDELFDRLFPARWREPSEVHWTSTEIVRRIIELVRPRLGERVLDVGSGAGKFCLVGALLSPARFTGAERRWPLVEVARSAARSLGADGARFILQDAFAMPWDGFDILYLFNPFEEHLMAASGRIDNGVPFSPAAYVEAVAEVTRRLEGLKVGTRVVLYWGFGGSVPPSFELLHRELDGDGALEVWRKAVALT